MSEPTFPYQQNETSKGGSTGTMEQRTKDQLLSRGPWKVECVEPGAKFSGDNWLVASLGEDHDGRRWYITTDCVPASMATSEPAADAKAIVEWRNSLCQMDLSIEQITAQRDEAIAMLADWCARVEMNGTSWDDWDEAYKNAWFRPCGIRSLLDAAIAETKKEWDRE